MSSDVSDDDSRCGFSCLASEAFYELLKTLYLKDFPCGIGSWTQEGGDSKQCYDPGPHTETKDVLYDLAFQKNSPWTVDYEWSNDARSLREIAIHSPWLIKNSCFIWNHFRTLKIVDKGVTEVDQEFVNLGNLENLILSANFLQSVDSRNLPKSLKILELYGNEICSLADLILEPPPLQHLGLGCNNLMNIQNHITVFSWPYLVSLDLFHNHLDNLIDVVDSLHMLPKLRTLILQANPLYLVPAYRGYIVDRLKCLSFLDDLEINVDEKHVTQYFADMTSDTSLKAAKILLKVPFLKGIPLSEEEQKNLATSKPKGKKGGKDKVSPKKASPKKASPNKAGEYPIVTKRYFVQFTFLASRMRSCDAAEINSLDDNLHAEDTASPSQKLNESPNKSDTTADTAGTKGSKHKSKTSESTLSKKDGKQTEAASNKKQTEANKIQLVDNITPAAHQENTIFCPESFNEVVLVPVQTFYSEWDEEILLNWTQILDFRNLLALRNFIEMGMQVAVMEEKILSNPAPAKVETGSGDESGKAKDDKKGKKGEKPKEKEKPKKKEDAKKKKKGEDEVELVQSPPEFMIIKTFHFPLNELLQGKFDLSRTFTHDFVEKPLPSAASPEPEKTKNDKKKEKPGKDKDKGKDAKKKGGKPPKGKKGAQGDDDLAQPLELQVFVRLQHFNTTDDIQITDEAFKNLPSQDTK